MIIWDSVNRAYYFFLTIPLVFLGLIASIQGLPGLSIGLPVILLGCVISPALVHMAASSHNRAGLKLIQSWVFFVASNMTAMILLIGWPAYSAGTFVLVGIGYVTTWILARVFVSWSRTGMNKTKRMYIGVGRNLGFLIPIIIFVVAIIGEAGLNPLENISIAAFVLVFLYPVIMLVSWVTILYKLSLIFYSHRDADDEQSNAEGWIASLRESQPWADLAVLAMVFLTVQQNRKVFSLLVLSFVTLLAIFITFPYLGRVGWSPILIESGVADILLVTGAISYGRLDRTELVHQMQL